MNKAIKATIGGKVDNKNINLLDKFFEIPAYQRLYEWESTQIEELLNDIKKAWEPYILQDSKSSEDLPNLLNHTSLAISLRAQKAIKANTIKLMTSKIKYMSL